MTDRPPLNGTATHPLSAHAISVLRDLSRGPVERHLINPGVRDRFWRESLAEDVELPGARGKTRPYLRITEAGTARLRELDRG